MSSSWSVERVLALAPDSGSVSAGQGLAVASKWSELGTSERAVWGHCQGSGKSPYQVRVDLSEPAFKCSCPSRKFPCKHGIALMLLLAKGEKALTVQVNAQAEPGWVSEWIDGRGAKAQKKSEQAAALASKPVDAEAQAERQTERQLKRESRVHDGVAQCRIWLDDLVRMGLAAAQSESQSFWEQPAARMVDAQAPGIGTAIRAIGAAIASGEGWEGRTLHLVGRLHLILCAFERLDALPPPLVADVRMTLGMHQSKDEVLAQAGVRDRWLVLGQITEEEDRLKVRRTWMIGRTTSQRALVLDFAPRNQPLDGTLIGGTEFEGEMAFYPSSVPLRGLVKVRHGSTEPMTEPPDELGDSGCEKALETYAHALGTLPWLFRWPMMLRGVTPHLKNRRAVVDSSGRMLPIKPRFADFWKLVSISAGHPVTLIGEWDGEHLLPLSVLVPGPTQRFVDLSPGWAS